MKKVIATMMLSVIVVSAAEPAKPLTPQQRAAQRRAQATNAPSAKTDPIKLGPQYQIQVAHGVMVTIKSTNTFSSIDAARWLRQAAVKIQTNR